MIRTHSEETKKKMREAKLKNPTRFWLGKKNPHSEESKLKIKIISIKNGNRPPSPLGRRKLNPITPLNKRLRMSLEYKLWRTAVFERDNYTCVWCGEVGKKLNADHIKKFAEYPALRFAIDNGRTLCVSCHKKTDNFGNKKQMYG